MNYFTCKISILQIFIQKLEFFKIEVIFNVITIKY
jgi:hypothetical protein